MLDGPDRAGSGRSDRKVLVVVSGRADAAPLSPVIGALRCCVAVCDLEGLTSSACVQATTGFLRAENPDCMLVLGDRFEILGACYAATVAQVPIAHVHGGEASHGSFDDQIRHAVSKLAHLHFVSCEPYADRLRRMGERRIWIAGAPGLDNLVDLPARKPSKTLVVTYHPETNGESNPEALVSALRRFPDHDVLWTGTNNDPGAERIRRAFSGYPEARLTPRQYLLACRHAAAVVGNSSSGLIECPSLGVPSVDIGSRQHGRLHGPSVLHVEHDEIESGIRAALEYRGPFDNPCHRPGASRRIAEVLETIDLEGIRQKPWFS